MKTEIYPALIILFAGSFCRAQNVGIGTLQPLYKLHVSTTSGNNLMLENLNTLYTGSSNNLFFTSNVNSGGAITYTGAIKSIGTSESEARMGFFTYAGSGPGVLLERLSIADNGNVGIGTINPGYRLDVNGNANVTGNETITGNETVNGNVAVNGNLTVANGKGIMRSVNSTQLKYYSRDAGFALTLGAFGSYDASIGFTNGIFASAPRVLVGDVVSGTGEFQKLRLVIFDVTPNNCQVRLYNDSNATISVDAVWSIICIGN